MQRLLKLVQTRGKALEFNEKNEGIFDVKTYQNTFDKLSHSSSIEQLISNKYKRTSFSENSNKNNKSNYSFSGNRLSLKSQIMPHQAKLLSTKIAELIKTKIQNNKKYEKQTKMTKSVADHTSKGKMSTYSAYVNARKKILQKNSLLDTNPSSVSFVKDHKQKSLQQIKNDIQNKQKQLLIIDKTSVSALRECDEGDSEDGRFFTNFKRPQLYLQKIVTKSRIDALRERRQMQIIANRVEEYQIPQIKTPLIRKGYLTVIKKKKTQSHLMISNSKRQKQRHDRNQIEPITTGFDAYKKNFIGQKNMSEQEIDFLPFIEKITINKHKLLQNHDFSEFNSKSVTILHSDNNNINNIFGYNQKQKLQIASITKVMTCFLTLAIAEKFCIDIKKQRVMVSQRASKMSGTSARLCYADTCTIYQILHGLMLPSGNDAAIALGEWGGKIIRKCSALLRRYNFGDTQTQLNATNKSLNFLSTYAVKRKSNVKLFVHHMNKLSKFLHLSHTLFVNTHGLMNQKAYSCSSDVALLTYYAMKNHIFREIVGKKQYKCKLFNRTFSHSKDISWENTNKLLSIQGFLGVKTGITPAAGPCLTSFFQVSPNEYFIVSILKTKSCEMRFKQTINLLKTTLSNMILISNSTKTYKKALGHLQKYDKLDLKEDELQYLNTCRQSTISHSQKEDEEQKFNQF